MADRWRGLGIVERIAVVGLLVAIAGVLVNAFIPVLVAQGLFDGSRTKDSQPAVTVTSLPPKPSSSTSSPGLPTPAATAAWLDELSPVDGRPDYTGLFAVNGKDITHGVGFDSGRSEPKQASYDLGGHYSTFEMDLVIGDGGNSPKTPAHFDVLGDGTSLLSGGVDIAPASGLVHKSISVAGLKRLTLVVTAAVFPQAMFGNARILP